LALQLTFDFEDKLKKFIEENCGYNFNIVISNENGYVTIEDNTESGDMEDLRLDNEELKEKVEDLEGQLATAESDAEYYREKLLNYENDI